MRITLVSGMFPPIKTGTSFYTRNLALALQNQNHMVEVITLGPIDLNEEKGLKVHRLKSVNIPLTGFFKHFRFSSFNFLNWWRIYSILKNNKADVILVVNHYLDIIFLAIFSSWLLKIPLICSVGTQLQSIKPFRNRILNILDRLICGYLIFPFCSLIVAWDNQILQYLRDIHGSKILKKVKIVNYGVAGNANDLINKKKKYSYSRLILGVGAVSEQRSFVPLVQAFALLANDFPSLKLQIIGHVYYEKAVHETKRMGLADKVDFVGELEYEKVLDIMSSSDVFYSSLTGKYKGLGTATIEAMLLGVPCIVNTPTNLLGIGKLKDGIHFIQSIDSIPYNIATKIRILLESEKKRYNIGREGKAFVKKYLNWEKVAKDMSTVIKKQIKKKY